MKQFLDENFMINNSTGQVLYHEYAAHMPIFDYHSHLIPEQIAENTRFRNLYEIWLTGDHYRWRAMRSFGIDEHFITGDAAPYEKFKAYAQMMPYTMGNPLYHWSHLELKRYFGITTLLRKDTAKEIWDKSAQMLEENQWGARDFLKLSNVKVVCTTDDPIDSLEHHQKIAADTDFKIKILPTFRPDKALAVEDRKGYMDYIARLSDASGVRITSYGTLLDAIKQRHDFFHQNGCRISDHALRTSIFQPDAAQRAEKLFDKYIKNDIELNQQEIECIQTAILTEIAAMNRNKNWTMQLHLGAMRNNNTLRFQKLGPDTGFDSIGDGPIAENLSAFLNGIELSGGLPKTILYSLNPSDNYTIGTMIGNFQGDGIPGKIQFGSGWWFNDQRDGMEAQMNALANLGLLSQFVGMLTDSRSFLSFPRHEYFRRILCNMIGEWVENGEFPHDMSLLGEIVQNICFTNAKNYFDVDN